MPFNADLLYQKYVGRVLSYAIELWYNKIMEFLIKSRSLGEHLVVIDDEDKEKVISLGKWSVEKHRAGLYAVKTINYKKVYLHRFLAKTPKGKVTDHINGNTLDNRKSNLRVCTNSANLRNSSKTIGVSWLPKRNKWLAQITVKRKNVFLGHFKTKKEALIARQTAVERYWSI